MRYIITVIWSCIFCEIIGFIAASLTQMQFNPMQSLIIGAVFGLLFAIIIPAITAKSHKDIAWRVRTAGEFRGSRC